jgi:hypothetical protein
LSGDFVLHFDDDSRAVFALERIGGTGNDYAADI